MVNQNNAMTIIWWKQWKEIMYNKKRYENGLIRAAKINNNNNVSLIWYS